MEHRTKLVAVTVDPCVIQQIGDTLADRQKGYFVTKVSDNGRATTKTMFVDRMNTRFFYTPSAKPFAESSFMFSSISVVSIDPDDAPKKCPEGFPLTIRTHNKRHATFVFEIEAHRDEVAQYLAHRARTSQDGIPEDPYKARLYDLWMQADVNGDNTLSFEELHDLIAGLNIDMSDRTLDKQFKRFDKDNTETFSFKEFAGFYEHLTQVEALKPFFLRFREGDLVQADGLQRFFREAFAEEVSHEMCERLIRAYSGSKSPVGISFREFTTFLLDTTDNNCYNPAHTAKVYQDMTQPLHHYFIASSHNTYLSGDQLQSTSKVEMYKRALLSGCRCVELDCWDGPAEEPVVYHGYTRTTKIKFQAAISAINSVAFETSEYPIILSLEVHTSALQAGVMARMLRATFGAQLYTAADHARLGYWTPEQLKGRVLIKWKSSDVDPADEKDTDGAEEIAKAKSSSASQSGGSESSASKLAKSGKDDLMRLVAVAAKKYEDWGESASGNHITSFSEGQVARLGKEHREDFVKQNCRMLARTYPAGSRVDSSNYNPLPAWELGAQAVALNYQTWDRWMRAYDGRFRQNGRCGYVLKPAYLRDASAPVPTQKYTLRVTVLVGSQLPKPDGEHTKGEIIDPYVELTLLGSEADTAANAVQRTKVVNDNGFNPLWNETFTFSVTNMDLALLSLRVLDKDDVSRDDEIGEAVVPLNALNLGYRAVSLSNCATGRALDYATVLCHFALVKE